MRLLFLLIFILPTIAFSQNDTTAQLENEIETFDVHLGIPLGVNGATLLGVRAMHRRTIYFSFDILSLLSH